MSEYPNPQHDFLIDLRQLKNETYPFEHLSAYKSLDPNERKHKRFPIEAYFLQRIAATYKGQRGYDEGGSTELEEQLTTFQTDLENHIAEFIPSTEYTRRLAVYVMPYLRKRNKEEFLFRAERMSYEEAAIQTLTGIFQDSIRVSLQDDLATINTMHGMTIERFPDATPDQIAAIIARSTQPNEWFAHSNGKYDSPMKKLMGRFDEEGEDTYSYNKDFFIWKEKDNLFSIELNVDRLFQFRHDLQTNISTQSNTDTIYCPGIYTPIIDMMWKSVIDIYRRTGCFEKSEHLPLQNNIL